MKQRMIAYSFFGVLIALCLGATYPYFSPGGALSGTWNVQNVNLAAGSPFITGVLPAENVSVTTTVTATFGTGWTVNPSQNWVLTKTGTIVNARIVNNMTGTSNSTQAIASGVIPAAYRPAATISLPAGTFNVVNNGTNAKGCVNVGSTGTIAYGIEQVSGSCGTASWTNTGTKTISSDAFSFTWGTQ